MMGECHMDQNLVIRMIDSGLRLIAGAPTNVGSGRATASLLGTVFSSQDRSTTVARRWRRRIACRGKLRTVGPSQRTVTCFIRATTDRVSTRHTCILVRISRMSETAPHGSEVINTGSAARLGRHWKFRCSERSIPVGGSTYFLQRLLG